MTNAATVSTERFEELPIAALIASKTNPRTHFADDYIDELAKSIAEKGLIQPIIVRTNGKPGTYEIVAGECRYRASKVAKLERVPAIIRQYTDEQALEIQLIENIHRTDLTPLERARGYRRLIDTNPTKHSAESIATRIGMSPAWVWDTMKLLDLIPEAQQLLDDERISAGHAILIARLKPEHQKRVIDPGNGRNGYNNHRDGLWQFQGGGLEFADDESTTRSKYDDLKAVSVRELDSWIRHHIRFDAAHAAQAQPLVFEQTAAKVIEAAAQPGRGRKVIAITHEYRVAEDARDDKERTYGSQSWQRADGLEKSKTCEHSVLGVVVAGAGYGDTFEVCVARDRCRVHFGQVIRQKEKNTKLRDSGQAGVAVKREAAAEAKARREQEERARREERWNVFKPALTKAVHAAAGKMAATLPKPVYQKVLAHHRLPPGTTRTQLQRALLAAAIHTIFDRYSWHNDEPVMVAWAKLLGVDVKGCEPKAALQTSGGKAKPKAKR